MIKFRKKFDEKTFENRTTIQFSIVSVPLLNGRVIHIPIPSIAISLFSIYSTFLSITIRTSSHALINSP